MKQAIKNETVMLDLINKIQSQLIVLDKKIDTLMSRSVPPAKPEIKPVVNNNQSRPNDRNKERVMFKAICADCKKECSIPFKPSGERPVYCQDCFSRRKVISISRIGLDDKPKDPQPSQPAVEKETVVEKPQVKSKKKTVFAKKPAAKKKTTPKKK